MSIMRAISRSVECLEVFSDNIAFIDRILIFDYLKKAGNKRWMDLSIYLPKYNVLMMNEHSSPTYKSNEKLSHKGEIKKKIAINI